MISIFWDFLINNVEGIIATCALTLTLWQIYLTKSHDKLSVRPHLGLFQGYDTSDNIFTYEIYIQNDGLGPAEICDFKIYFDKKALANSILEIQEKLSKKIDKNFDVDGSIISFKEGAVISTNEVTQILYLEIPYSTEQEFIHIQNALNQLDLKIEYKSFYGQKFSFNTCEDERLKLCLLQNKN